jgi:dephospho-CoA kinase
MASRPLVIGLTGGLAAGKSEALAAFDEAGAETISADLIVHELLGTPEILELLRERWGDDVVTDGEVDRGAVGNIVFGDPAEIEWLEKTLHPRVGERIASWLGGLPPDTRIAVVEVPLLFEAGMGGVFDTTVAVVADDSVRRERAGVRDQVMLEEREGRQLPQDEKAARADHILPNDGTVEELRRAAAELTEKLLAER